MLELCVICIAAGSLKPNHDSVLDVNSVLKTFSHDYICLIIL